MKWVMKKLATYIKDAGISQREFADRIGVDYSIVSRLARDGMRPSLDLAVRIERETGGEVPATSWVPEPAPAPETPEQNEDAA
jgi:transcriptional regulator with XRE-family HTH domain